ncbi:hypothetical protein H5410_031915 [Solanum commersonii]|uniref:Uncharacterized protein n=1 Tax=Solanum commersonii TaxID=4109 RepID=A0A9J5YJP2_SOLCO|nr:hypothetical protein H5410_031915 [Solanum commersonii]
MELNDHTFKKEYQRKTFSSSAASGFFVRRSPATVSVKCVLLRLYQASLFVGVQPPFQWWKLRLVPIAVPKKIQESKVLILKEQGSGHQVDETISCKLQHTLQ